MNNSMRRIFIAILMLALASLACATLSGGNPPAVPDTTDIEATAAQAATQVAQAATQGLQFTPEPGATTVPSEPTPAESEETQPSGDAGADTINLDDPSLYVQPAEINTYRLGLLFIFTAQAEDGTTITSSITGEGAYSVNPKQLSFSFQTTNSGVSLGTLEIVQLDNTLYMTSAELGCFSLPAESSEAENPYEELLDTGGFLTGQANRVQPDEVVNDIPVYVYEITPANLNTNDSTAQEVTELTQGYIYIAKDGGYIVRLVLDGRGNSTLLTDQADLIGDVHYELNYFGQNQPVDIVRPENCPEDAGGGTGDSGGGVATSDSFPVPDGATDMVSLPGITTFSSDQTVENLTTFYKTEMVAAGWTIGEEVSVTGFVTMTFTKDGTTATISLIADASTGKTLVTILEG